MPSRVYLLSVFAAGSAVAGLAVPPLPEIARELGVDGAWWKARCSARVAECGSTRCWSMLPFLGPRHHDGVRARGDRMGRHLIKAGLAVHLRQLPERVGVA